MSTRHTVRDHREIWTEFSNRRCDKMCSTIRWRSYHDKPTLCHPEISLSRKWVRINTRIVQNELEVIKEVFPVSLFCLRFNIIINVFVGVLWVCCSTTGEFYTNVWHVAPLTLWDFSQKLLWQNFVQMLTIALDHCYLLITLHQLRAPKFFCNVWVLSAAAKLGWKFYKSG